MGLFNQQSKRLLITKSLTKPSVYFFSDIDLLNEEFKLTNFK